MVFAGGAWFLTGRFAHGSRVFFQSRAVWLFGTVMLESRRMVLGLMEFGLLGLVEFPWSVVEESMSLEAVYEEQQSLQTCYEQELKEPWLKLFLRGRARSH